jgi:hypothetical protein
MSQMRFLHVTLQMSLATSRFTLACLLLASASARAADPVVEEKIKSIRAKYAQIEKGLKDCRQVKRELPGESAEGGELIGYFKDRSVEKLSATFFGETGKAEEQYYFWNTELIFVVRAEWHYTKPMSGVTKSKTEQRFYFADGKLIRWLNPDKKEVTADAAKADREAQVLAGAKKYSRMAAVTSDM